MRHLKIISSLVVIVILIYIFVKFDIQQYLTLDFLKTNISILKSWVDAHMFLAAVVFFSLYTIAAALSLPGLTVFSISAGSLFGLWKGVLLVSFASTAGATIAFLASRFLFKKYLLSKFGKKLEEFNSKIEKDCSFYLLSLRLIPISPFMMVNIMMGLSNLTMKRFVVISQVGMLFATIIYVNAGLQLAEIESVASIFSYKTIFAFFMLSLVPLVIKKYGAFSSKN